VQAVLLKVASMGLIPRLHLGKELGVLRAHLHKLDASYGVHICGEGGEYETLTLDCPLFRRRMVLSRTEAVGDLRTDIAPVAVLRIVEWHTEPKSAEEHDPVAACKATTRSGRSVGYEREEEEAGDEGAADWRRVQAAAAAAASTSTSSTVSAAATSSPAPQPIISVSPFDAATPVPDFPAANVVGDFCFVAAVPTSDAASPAAAADSSSSSSSSAGDTTAAPAASASVGAALERQVQHVVSSLQSASASASGDKAAAAASGSSFALEDVLYVQLFVPRMERDFASANERYKQLFSMSNAPSRACVQLAAPSSHSSSAVAASASAAAVAASSPTQEAPLQLDVVACRRPRDVLHVQSISAWAPACIGPYSQSSSCAPLLWLAGQIGLEPETMLLSPEPRAQAALALRHCAQVLRAQGSAWNRAVSVVLYWQTDFWRTQQPFVRQVVLPMVLRRMRLPSDDNGVEEKAWTKAAKSVVHVVVPCLPRNALLEVQLIAAAPPAPPAPLPPLAAMHLPSIASEAVTMLPVSCQVHASHAQGSFASIWADLTVDATAAAPTAADASVSTSSASVDPASACALLVSRVSDALHSLHSSWRQVLVLRVYLSSSSSSLSERDVRIGLHRAFQQAAAATGAAGGGVVVPALSVLHVSEVELQVVVDKAVAPSASSATTTLLAAHFILLSEESAAAAASSFASAAAAAASSS
jgi:enamine deaminase RidA (YjgF/YER057c/UK114 family)